MTNFFRNLPSIVYNGSPAKNFMALAKLSDKTLADKSLFYPYAMADYERVDALAGKYYDNPDYAWLIWITNNIVDPYYDVYLSDTDFHNFITKKYGSVEVAQANVAYWINAWSIDDSELTVAEYTALPSTSQKYYNPIIDPNNVVFQYARRQEDWKATTNQIVSMETTSNTAYTVGETVSQRYAANNLFVANGTVVFSNTTATIVNHTTGTFLTSNSSVFLHLYDSSNNTSNTISVDTQICIPASEQAFWSSVSYYDHEVNTNAARRDINLIDNRFKTSITNQLKKVMSE